MRGGGRDGVLDGVHGKFDDLRIPVLLLRRSAYGVYPWIGVLWNLLSSVVPDVLARRRDEGDADVAGVLGSDGERYGGAVLVRFCARLSAHSVYHAHQRLRSIEKLEIV